MTFSWYLTDARRELQDRARRFAMDEVLPLANELDPARADIPRSFLDRMGEAGWFGITLPAEVGGLGLGVFEYCLVAEELARAWMSVASIIARAQGMGTQIGDPARRRELADEARALGARLASSSESTRERPALPYRRREGRGVDGDGAAVAARRAAKAGFRRGTRTPRAT